MSTLVTIHARFFTAMHMLEMCQIGDRAIDSPVRSGLPGVVAEVAVARRRKLSRF